MDYSILIRKAMEYKERAYVPYSHFRVGAAILTENDSIFGGCNIENVSFGATNCAERTAIFKAVSEEGKTDIKAIAIVSDEDGYTYPCGICRQVISEFAAEDIKIILAKSEEEYIVKEMKDIFPEPFDKF
ncbi:cytidine deaminase [Clostridium neuense]|uniref:Cytidine deaminase n=1 Tax=Clostridium neuense TaxID=1728934 RepID=A0ABW8TF90_9CLOT